MVKHVIIIICCLRFGCITESLYIHIYTYDYVLNLCLCFSFVFNLACYALFCFFPVRASAQGSLSRGGLRGVSPLVPTPGLQGSAD